MKTYSRRSILPLALGLALLPLAPHGAAAAMSETPFRAGIAEIVSTVSCPPGTDPALTCGTIEGLGIATHLGLFTERGTSAVNLTTVPSTGSAAVTSQVTFIAANGDTLTVSVPGVGTFTSPTGGTLRLTYTVVSGTGRFAGATGSGSFSGRFKVISGGFYVTAEYAGTLTLAAGQDGQDR